MFLLVLPSRLILKGRDPLRPSVIRKTYDSIVKATNGSLADFFNKLGEGFPLIQHSDVYTWNVVEILQSLWDCFAPEPEPDKRLLGIQVVFMQTCSIMETFWRNIYLMFSFNAHRYRRTADEDASYKEMKDFLICTKIRRSQLPLRWAINYYPKEAPKIVEVFARAGLFDFLDDVVSYLFDESQRQSESPL